MSVPAAPTPNAPPDAGRIPPARMPRSRLILVHLIIAVIVVGSGFDIIVGREHWPFSNYPMYSRIEQDDTVTRLRFYGVPSVPDAAELPLLDERFIAPFDQTRLNAALQQLSRDPEGDRLLCEAARDTLARYELRRRASLHDSPPLRAIKLYRLTWQIDPLARNRDQPERRELLLEIDATR